MAHEPSPGVQPHLERIKYLEAKLTFLKQHCETLLESNSAASTLSSDRDRLQALLEAERARSHRLSEEVADLRAHRDDVVRQIQHQHQHVLELTNQLNKIKGLAGGPESLRGRILKRFL